ncbi:hypothetical protein MSPGM_16090 [Methylorubrum sp. GM97]|nr:hypothetical protein MSPGM_16090 [Methylorubrum sp. GM97]
MPGTEDLGMDKTCAVAWMLCGLGVAVTTWLDRDVAEIEVDSPGAAAAAAHDCGGARTDVGAGAPLRAAHGRVGQGGLKGRSEKETMSAAFTGLSRCRSTGPAMPSRGARRPRWRGRASRRGSSGRGRNGWPGAPRPRRARARGEGRRGRPGSAPPGPRRGGDDAVDGLPREAENGADGDGGRVGPGRPGVEHGVAVGGSGGAHQCRLRAALPA